MEVKFVTGQTPLFSVLVPHDREVLSVDFDGRPARPMGIHTLSGQPHSVHTFECEHPPTTVTINLKPA